MEAIGPVVFVASSWSVPGLYSVVMVTQKISSHFQQIKGAGGGEREVWDTANNSVLGRVVHLQGSKG